MQPIYLKVSLSLFLHSLGDKNGNGHLRFSIESIERHLQIVPSSASHFWFRKNCEVQYFQSMWFGYSCNCHACQLSLCSCIPTFQVSHCFPILGDYSCKGIRAFPHFLLTLESLQIARPSFGCGMAEQEWQERQSPSLDRISKLPSKNGVLITCWPMLATQLQIINLWSA